MPRLHSTLPGHAALALTLTLLVPAEGAAAPSVDDALWITDGSVYALAREGHTLYVGGRFQMVGPSTGSGVPISTSTAAPMPSYPKVLGPVYAVVPDGSGGWFIGGRFTRVGDEPRSGLAHVLADGRVADWNPGVEGEVRTMLLHRGLLYVGGNITACGGRPRRHAAAVDAALGLVADWAPQPDGPLRGIVAQGHTVFACGDFRQVGGKERIALAAVDDRLGEATSWRVEVGRYSSPLTLLVRGGTLYVGGTLHELGGKERQCLAAIDIRTGEVSDWSPQVGKSVRTMALHGSKLLAAGVGAGIAEVDLVTGSVSALAPGGQWMIINSLVLDGSTLYVGGSRWASLGGETRLGLAALNLHTGAVEDWDPRADGEVYCLAARDGVVYAGGEFHSIGGVLRRNAAAFDLRTGMATGWNPDPNNFTVRALAAKDGLVYVGGDFIRIGGADRMFLAAVDGATGRATPWNPEADCFDHQCFVREIAIGDGSVYVAGNIGYFRSNGWVARRSVGAADVATGVGTSWNPDPDREVSGIAFDRGRVLIGGVFSRIGGAAREGIAALDPVTAGATSWDPAFANGVQLHVGEFAADAKFVYAAGVRGAVNANERFVAPLDRLSGRLGAWSVSPNGGVSCLALGSGALFAGGAFTAIDGEACRYLAALNTRTGSVVPWDPKLDGAVRALVADGTMLYVGGDFAAAGDRPRPHLVAIRLDDLEPGGPSRVDRRRPRAPGSPEGVTPSSVTFPKPDLRVSSSAGAGVSLEYDLPTDSEVRLEVFDLAGRRVAVLVDAHRAAGQHRVEWNAIAGGSGVYFCRLRAGPASVTRSVIVRK